uniref:Uncharacterized protein n=1 Tax=Rhizophora mucronata TaxID=61149 RepID=A0A2P2QW20_RHIMU
MGHNELSSNKQIMDGSNKYLGLWRP